MKSDTESGEEAEDETEKELCSIISRNPNVLEEVAKS